MRKEEVPQNPGILGPWHELTYAQGGDGRYGTVPSAGWEPKNIANGMAWDLIRQETEAVLTLVRAGKQSPLAYHMVRNQMTPALLAEYAGFSSRKVRGHLTPAGFERILPGDLAVYARVLEMPPEQIGSLPGPG